ncbi:MAG: hypothetical protein QM589_16250 [Thermomicrobiales bacterium]
MSGAMPTLAATTIRIDFRANTLTVSVPLPAEENAIPLQTTGTVNAATLDIGTRGRLLGLELDSGDEPAIAIAIADPTPADAAVMRSARIPVTVTIHGNTESGVFPTLSIVFSRHGEDYDISWPSGNQCWRQAMAGADGVPTVTCAVVMPT